MSPQPPTIRSEYFSRLSASDIYGVVRHDAAERYLQGIMAKLWSASGGQGNPPFVFLTPDGSYNAQAMPEKAVFVNWRILKEATDEAEVAGVLAHEAAHLALNHFQSDVWTGGFQKTAMLGAMGLLLSNTGAAAIAPIVGYSIGGSALASIMTPSIGQPLWTRGQETEADKRAIDILVGSGYSVKGVESFLTRLSGSKDNNAKSGPFTLERGSGNVLFSIGIDFTRQMASHPDAGQRREEVQQYRSTKYPDLVGTSGKSGLSDLTNWKREEKPFLDASEHVTNAWLALRAMQDRGAKTADLLQYAENEISFVFPEAFRATRSPSEVLASPKGKKGRKAEVSARAETTHLYDSVRRSFFANFVALSVLNKRNDQSKVGEFVQRLLTHEETPLLFFLAVSSSFVQQKDYEKAIATLNEAQKRFGDQAQLYPYLIKAYGELHKSLRGSGRSSDANVAALKTDLKVSCYAIRCTVSGDFDLMQNCNTVLKEVQ